RSFADAARAREQVSVMQPLMLDGIAERARNWFLSGDFVEGLRAPLARDYLIGHLRLEGSCFRISGQTPDFPATHAAVATVAPFPAWRGSQSERCAEPGI